MINRVFDFKLSQKCEISFLNYCKDIIKKGFLTDHHYCRLLENEISKFYSDKEVISFSSATSALTAVLSTLKKDTTALIQSNTFVATPQACIAAGLKPVCFDIQDNYKCASYSSFMDIFNKLKNQNIKPTAAIIVPINGYESEESFKISKFCNENEILLIYDNAQGFNSKYNNKLVGSNSHYSVLSLHLTKILTGGEGGLLIEENKPKFLPEINVKVHKYFGIESNLIAKKRGLNGKLSEFNAALAFSILKNDFEERFNKRVKIDDIYKDKIKNKRLKPVSIADNNVQSFYKSIWLLNDANETKVFESFCKDNKINLTGKVYPVPVSMHPYFQENNVDFSPFNAKEFGETHVCLPNFPELDEENLDKIIKIINKF